METPTKEPCSAPRTNGKTIARIIFGSHLYGTNTETSDTDYKSIHLPPARDILLQKVTDSTGHAVIRPEGEKNTPDDIDDESYSLQRYLQLLAEGQTVAIDMLFAPANFQLTSTHYWGEIYHNRHKLLTKKSASFLGYCRTQANKYGIKGSRVSAAKKAMEFFEVWNKVDPHEKVGYAVSMDMVPSSEHERVYEKETTHGHTEQYYECCNRSVGFKNTVKEAYGIYKRIYEEYGKRARLAEANEGVDYKALSHAVRVGTEALELLNTGHVTFPLPNKEHILQIKKGMLQYKTVATEIESLLEQVEKASVTSKLREEPDWDWINDCVVTAYGREVIQYWGFN